MTRNDVQRLMDPVTRYLKDRGVSTRIAEEASERATDAMYRALEASTSGMQALQGRNETQKDQQIQPPKED